MKSFYRFIIVSTVLMGASTNIIIAQERARTQFQEYSTGPGSFIQGIPVTKAPLKGTVYLYENYSPGILITTDEEKVSDVNLRYNIQDQKIEMRKNNLDIQLNSRLIDSFHILNDSEAEFINVFSLPVDQNHGLDGFMQIYGNADGQMLLKRWYLNIKKANYNVALSTGTKYDEAIVKSEMFLVSDNQLISFQGKNKEIKSNFPNKSKELITFVKANKIKFKSNEDYILFFNYFSTLD
ncbi:hypothetical protein [Anditalea andensis]|uniref:Uncharacterized protein n=1 Tax=Anditalea andensis TaxID=1048983 RepID=A0A074L1E0_9BACT|nr:hypothetical protein [Anditalea andensis]KEO73643.1 hypothetical protein EL17_12140 [Anditalea andensis]